MSKLISRVSSGAKYAYILVFAVLLSGFFYPLITGADPTPVILGTLTIFLGLTGVILVLRAIPKRSGFYMWIGLGMVGLSLFFILALTGRI